MSFQNASPLARGVPMARLVRSRQWVAQFLAVGASFVVLPVREVAAEDKTPGKLETAPAIKRRTQTTDDDLRKQLQLAPEVGLDQPGCDVLYAPIVKAGSAVKNLPPDLGPRTYERLANQVKRPDMVAL